MRTQALYTWQILPENVNRAIIFVFDQISPENVHKATALSENV